MTALERTRLWREWREAWVAENVDWRTAYDWIQRRIGQRHRDGWVRVADSCEVEHFARPLLVEWDRRAMQVMR